MHRFGRAGLCLVRAFVASQAGNQDQLLHQTQVYLNQPSLHDDSDSGDTWTSGRAGFLHGLLLLRRMLLNFQHKAPPAADSWRKMIARLEEAADTTARDLLTSCRQYAVRSGSRAALMCGSDCHGSASAEYLGAANGICGVVQQLLLARPVLLSRCVDGVT